MGALGGRRSRRAVEAFERHLRGAIHDLVEHYHAERHHQGWET